MTETPGKQLLHLVFGGELNSLEFVRFQGFVEARHRRHLSRTTPPRTPPGKRKAQATVDNAQMRYFVVHLHRLLDPQDG